MNVPLKWFGGKFYLASRIVELFPPHLHYVEPFCGGCSVLLAHDGQNRSELVNDKFTWLTCFWRAMQDEAVFARFQRMAEATPLSRVQWEKSRLAMDRNEATFLPVEEAAFHLFVCCRQSRAGQMQSFTPPTRTRLRRGMNGNVSEWLSAVDGLPIVHERLRRVMIENMDGIQLIEREDTPGTLFYCDPPYLHETRESKNVYAHEMTADQHNDLLQVLAKIQGKFILSGYDSKLYRSYEYILGWNRKEFDIANHASGAKEKGREKEIVWMNF